MDMSPQKPILIIGGGLAGLSLGQGLKAAGIPFKILERDQAASFRAQGYRIHIDQQGGDALRQLLPPSLFERFEATSAAVIPGGHRLDAFSAVEIPGMGTMPPQIGESWNVDRTVLRNLLLNGIEEYIEFDKKFKRYRLTEDGAAACFADGSEIRGSFLVGGDGVNSSVRKQMVPECIVLDTEGRAVFGKTLIDATTFDTIPSQVNDGICLIVPPEESRMKLFTDVMQFDRTSDATADVDLPMDYIYWVLVFHKSLLSLSSSSPDAHALSESLATTFHSSLQQIITSQLPTASSNLQFLIAKPPLIPWPTDTRITLMGDAAHPMPPVGGVGANIAFQDARDLSGVLVESWNGSGRIVEKEKLAKYEQILRERSGDAISKSAMGAKRFFGMRDVQDLEKVTRLEVEVQERGSTL